MARVPELVAFCKRYGLKMISVADLIRYRMQTERFIEFDGEGQIRTAFGTFKVLRFVSRLDNETHLALVHGEITGREDVLVRVHSHCVYGDVFASIDCDCHSLIESALQVISRSDCGVFAPKSLPSLASFSCTSGSLRMLRSSAPSLFTIAGGVRAGRKTPDQLIAS